ncbi:MAG: Bax inhibitor-1/YccA family protein, partial [Anaerolineales bacterium]|nr:Bax inhibitor-1/YccA family protein [Anaerolineales bacterium]
MNDYQDPLPLPVSETRLAEMFTSVMSRVYLWMFMGLLVTTGAAFFALNTTFLWRFLYNFPLGIWLFFGGEILLVIAIGRTATRLAPGVAISLFFAYAFLNGLTMSIIFLIYDLGTITLAFGTTAVLFGILSVVGYTTKQDLSKWGGILFMGLIGLIVASVANMFLANSTLDWIITYAGILLFMGLTVYDTKRIKMMAYAAAAQTGGDTAVISRIGILGALRLYL